MAQKDNQLWNELLDIRELKKGWHQAHHEYRRDFAEDPLHVDAYAAALDRHLADIRHRLSRGRYRPRPALRCEVPKGPLGYRPGTVIDIEDRVVLYSAIRQIAPAIDEQLSDSVFSWRLKNPLPRSDWMFKDTTIEDMPYLKSRTVSNHIDQFEYWLSAWPEFDNAGRAAFTEKGHRFMATCDIAAYFENIHLGILRDKLMQWVPIEPRIINLIVTCLSYWCPRTPSGGNEARGIPQGTGVSSFLGNVFLKGLDDRLEELAKQCEADYQRYMDDVRFFAKRREDARRAILIMERTLRELHLNVQSAKTKILDEDSGEISEALVDQRLDDIDEMEDEIRARDEDDEAAKRGFLANLKRLEGRQSRSDRQAIKAARKPLTGLTLRLFKRWVSCHRLLGSHDYVKRLQKEVERTSDAKLTSIIIRTARDFPSLRSIAGWSMKFIHSELNVFAHQEAELLRAIRNLARVPEDAADHAWKVLLDTDADPYLRMQAGFLLSRTELTKQRLSTVANRYDQETDSFVSPVWCLLLIQRRRQSEVLLADMMSDPVDRVRRLGWMFYRAAKDEAWCRKQLDYVFGPVRAARLSGYMPIVWAAANCGTQAVQRALLEKVNVAKAACLHVDLRPTLEAIQARLERAATA